MPWADRLLTQIWRVKDRAPIYFTGVSHLRQIRLNTKKGRNSRRIAILRPVIRRQTENRNIVPTKV
jgi:hypothetical protein